MAHSCPQVQLRCTQRVNQSQFCKLKRMENVDTFNGVRICCFVLGVGMLTPWSIVVGALDYWQNVTATDTMNADMSFVFMAFNFIFLWGCIYAVGRYDFFKENGTTAISSGFVLFLLPLLIVTTDSSPSYGLLIFLSALLGAGQAVTQTETMRLRRCLITSIKLWSMV